MSTTTVPPIKIPNFPWPNLVPQRTPLPIDFKLVPDLGGGTRAVPVTPTIPAVVATGDVITAAHENSVRQAISDLWVDVQALDTGKLADPTSAAGDLLVRGSSAVVGLPVGPAGSLLTADPAQPTKLKWATASAAGIVPATRQVIAGAGMTGGGALSADVTLNANVVSVFGRTGAVVLTTADLTTAGGVAATRQVIAGTGMTGGGALTADVTLNAKVTSVFGRIGDVALTNADIGAAGGVTSVFGRTGAVVLTNAEKGAMQTPWLQDVDGGNFTLKSVGKVGIAAAVPGCALDVVGFIRAQDFATAPTTGAGLELSYSASNNWGRILAFDRSGGVAKDIRIGISNGTQLALPAAGGVGIGTGTVTGALDVVAVASGRMNITFTNNSAGALNNRVRLRLGPWLGFLNTDLHPYIESVQDDAGAGGKCGLAFGTYDATGPAVERVRITNGGNVGIGIASGPVVRLDVMGGAGGAPAVSGIVSNACLRVRNSTGTNVIDFGHNNSSPFTQWIQSTNSSDLSANFPLVLNPNGGGVLIGVGGGGFIIADAAVTINTLQFAVVGATLYFKWRDQLGTIRQANIVGA